MKIENKATAQGVGFTGLLAVAFIVLKLCHVINWSWWWVLSPIWIPITLIIVAAVIFLCWAFISSGLEERRKSKS